VTVLIFFFFLIDKNIKRYLLLVAWIVELMQRRGFSLQYLSHISWFNYSVSQLLHEIQAHDLI